MSLDSVKLASALADLFDGVPSFPSDVAKAGQQWADIYRGYASNALAGPTAPVDAVMQIAVGVLGKALAGAFKAATKAGAAGAATILPLMDAAFLAFWATPIPFAPPLPAPPAFAGIVTPPASGSLASLMTIALAAGLSPGASTALQGKAVAGALDTWTKTVSVVNTPLTPPGPPQKPVTLA
jgi:hypothetical protein